MYLPSCPCARTTEKSRLLLLFVNVSLPVIFLWILCALSMHEVMLSISIFNSVFLSVDLYPCCSFFSQYLDSFFPTDPLLYVILEKKVKNKKDMYMKGGRWEAGLPRNKTWRVTIISRERPECSREKRTWAQPLRFLGAQSRHLCPIFSPRFSIAIT